MEGSQEISFQIYYEDTVTPINFESEKTITEFKEFACLCLECNPSESALYLESYGRLDVEDLLEFPLSLIELKPKNEYSYKLFCVNKTKLEQLIKHNAFCTQKIFSLDKNLTKTPMSQYGLRIKNKENKLVCLACARLCHPNDFNLSQPEDYKEENFVCECSQIKGNKCMFDSCELTYIFGEGEKDDNSKNEIIIKCKNILAENNSERKKVLKNRNWKKLSKKYC